MPAAAAEERASRPLDQGGHLGGLGGDRERARAQAPGIEQVADSVGNGGADAEYPALPVAAPVAMNSMTSGSSFLSVACLLRSCARIAARRFQTLSDRVQPASSVFVGCGWASTIAPMAWRAIASTQSHEAPVTTGSSASLQRAAVRSGASSSAKSGARSPRGGSRENAAWRADGGLAAGRDGPRQAMGPHRSAGFAMR